MELYDRAQRALEVDNFDLARQCLRQAVDLAPQNVVVVDAFGALLAEVGPQSEAIDALKRAVELSPDSGFEKYMYLGQLLEGEEGLQYLTRGVQLLQKDTEALAAAGAAAAEERSAMQSQLAGAYCTLAEKHMDGNPEVAAVEEAVEDALRRARQADANSPEPLQALASLRVEQGRPDEALAVLHQSMALWHRPAPQPEPDDSGSDGEGCPAAGASKEMDHDAWREEDEEPPSFEFRFECVKLLLELEETIDTAVELLEELLEEDDRALDVWYLLAMCLYNGGDFEDALDAAQRGHAAALKVFTTLSDSRWDFLELKANIEADMAAELAEVEPAMDAAL